MSSVLMRSVTETGAVRGYCFRCPGCSTLPNSSGLHYVRTAPATAPDRDGPVWGFNGNEDAPTFTPSILVNGSAEMAALGQPRCHSFVTAGKIQFLGDCSHTLAGQTVPLPPFEPRQ